MRRSDIQSDFEKCESCSYPGGLVVLVFGISVLSVTQQSAEARADDYVLNNNTAQTGLFDICQIVLNWQAAGRSGTIIAMSLRWWSLLCVSQTLLFVMVSASRADDGVEKDPSDPISGREN